MVFEWIEIFEWVWNGNGFFLFCEMLFSEIRVDFVLYILIFFLEMLKFKNLFYCFGMRYESDFVFLFEVFEMIKLKYDSRKFQCMFLEVKCDIKLLVEILNELVIEQLSFEMEIRIFFFIYVEEDIYV